MASIIYNTIDKLLTTVDYENDTIRAMLVNGYIPNTSLEYTYNDVSAYEVAGLGYTAGGIELSNKTITKSGNYTYFKADNIEWLNTTFSSNGMIVYSVDTNTLIVFHDFSQVYTSEEKNFIVEWPVDGVMKIQR